MKTPGHPKRSNVKQGSPELFSKEYFHQKFQMHVNLPNVIFKNLTVTNRTATN